MWLVGLALLGTVGIAGFVMVSKYNELVKSKNKVKNAWAHIEAQLQRRFDLVPNLVETVKAFAEHERQLIESVVAARGGFMNAHSAQEKMEMDAQLSANLKSLFVMVENYPQLKADAHFMQLQSALTEIEEDISYARQFYNDAVTLYNNQLMMFPSNIIASAFNFKEEVLFTAVKGASIAPKVVLQTVKYVKCPVCEATVDGSSLQCKYCGCNLTQKS